MGWYSYPVNLTDAEAFRRSLLLALTWESKDGWIPLLEAMQNGIKLAEARYDRKLTVEYSTLKKAKSKLQAESYIEQRRVGKHFELRLTPKGAGLDVDQMDESETGRVVEYSFDGNPFRVGKGHLMPAGSWRVLLNLVKVGTVDILIIPAETKTKTKYWDEK